MLMLKANRKAHYTGLVLNRLVLQNVRYNRLKTAVDCLATSPQIGLILIAVGMRQGIASDPNAIRTAFGVLAIVALSFLIVISFCLAVVERRSAILERTQEFAILKMLGASSSYICKLLLEESLLIANPAALLGLLMSCMSKWLIEWLLTQFVIQALGTSVV